MKKLMHIAVVTAVVIAFTSSNSFAQVAPEKSVSLRVVSDGLILVGQDSKDSQVGPYFGGSVAYGLGYGFTIYAESGFGWTNYHSTDGLRLVQIPVLGGATYNFGDLWNSSLVQPYIGVAGGVFNYLQQRDWNTITVAGNEQKTTQFGLEGIAGVNFKISDHIAVDVRAKYDHVFSDRGRPGIENQEWNNVGVGGGISYYFHL